MVAFFSTESYLDFYKDLLLAQVNGTNISDINNSVDFAEVLTTAIHQMIRKRITTNIKMQLDSTKQLRPVSLIADKLRQTKEHGTSCVWLCPKNQITKHLITMLMLGSEVVLLVLQKSIL